MRFYSTLLAALALGLAPAHAADSTPDASNAPPPSLRVLQRIFHPARPSEPFVDRGALQLAYPPHGHRAGPVAAAFVQDADATPAAEYVKAYVAANADAADAEEPVDLDAALYQLALVHPGDTQSAQWHVSSVKACHLAHATAEHFTLHLSAAGEPYALDYFVGPVPHDGACTGSAKARRRLLAEHGTRIANSSVALKAPTHPPLPSLRAPPQLSAEGKVVVPPAEKSFIQKYWMYIAIAFLALAVSGSPAEEEGAGQGR
ncbi:hypothetical protein PsYK624_001440 [Phanerochaete sordida]|uniref:ER membrane protein complex subunit 10 n=1 Tax=Phanerochaete sordida TaxID=48140 RepID=A0A9P3L720_9APHY|nr:hypothetical protein PsYK624_001440 [Phanerochaete sordida]